jgi:hypothetical protein
LIRLKKLEKNMQYLLMFYNEPALLSPPQDEAKRQAWFGSWMAYIGALNQSGVAVSGHGLQHPHTATTVRLRGDQRQVQDGPFADTKEMLGGYYVIDVPDLDEALAWAARCPAALTGSVEVRPVMSPPPQAAKPAAPSARA